MEQKHSKVVIYNYMDIANPKAGGAEKYCFEKYFVSVELIKFKVLCDLPYQ